MNAQVPAVAKPQLHTGGQVAALVPQTLEEAFRVANAFAVSGLAPQSLKTAEGILVAIMAGAELGFAPYQAMQSFAVINGRASIWGDAIPALLWSRGFDIEEWFDDEDNATKAFCKVTRPGGKVVERTFSLKDAKLANLIGKQGPWQTAQKRMLQMRARAFAARDGAADVLRGMPVYEEVADYQEIREVRTGPAPTGMRARLEARTAGGQGFDADHVARETGAAQVLDADDGVPAFDKVTGEIIDAEVEEIAEANPDDAFPGDRQRNAAEDAEALAQAEQTIPATEQPKATLAERAAAFRTRMGEATNPTKLKSIRRAADNLFDDMEKSDPEGRVELAFEYEERLSALEDAERDAAKGGAA